MGELAPVFGIFTGIVALCIPIVAILAHHQRKMAEIVHRNHAGAGAQTGQIEALRREVAELKQLVHQQMIAVDNLVASRSPSIEARERSE